MLMGCVTVKVFFEFASRTTEPRIGKSTAPFSCVGLYVRYAEQSIDSLGDIDPLGTEND